MSELNARLNQLRNLYNPPQGLNSDSVLMRLLRATDDGVKELTVLNGHFLEFAKIMPVKN
jgi:hypothetical protein